MAQMKPQFDPVLMVRNEADRQVVELAGPIDLQGDEEDLYIWVMLHQDAFEQGTSAYEKDGVQKLVDDARDALNKAVEKSQVALSSREVASPGQFSKAALALQDVALAGTPKWRAEIAAKPGTFSEGDAKAEAVAIVRAKGMNYIVWWDDDAKLEFKATASQAK